MIATNAHPSDAEIEGFVLGANTGTNGGRDAHAALEQHLGGCEACRERATRTAAEENMLEAAGEAALFCPGCSRLLVDPLCEQCGAAARAGAFTIDSVIVRSSHGRIYRAHDQDGRTVALKELAFVHAPTAEAIAAFEREARVLQQLEHPQIPRFVAAFTEGEGIGARLYLAQEYIDGESLLVELQRRTFGEQDARALADQILGVLEYLQGLSPPVFHRDVKPANLIRRPDGTVALVDFGAARDLGATVGATLVGTFGYMPVEQLAGIVDSTSDLYALGATLFHAISRVEPWRAMDDPGAIERLPVSPPFRRFLARLMARRPEDRFPDATAALEALRNPRRAAVAKLGPARILGRGPLMMILGGAAALGVGLAVIGPRQATVPQSRSLHGAEPPAKRFAGRRIDLDFYDADIHNILRLLADVGRMNIVVSDEVQGHVTLKMRAVSWDEALDAIVRGKHLTAIQQGNVIRVEVPAGLQDDGRSRGNTVVARTEARGSRSATVHPPGPARPPRGIFDGVSLEELRLIAIIGDVAGERRAMFTAGSGLGFSARRGDTLAKQAARIVDILPDRVVLEVPQAAGSGSSRPSRREIVIGPGAP